MHHNKRNKKHQNEASMQRKFSRVHIPYS